MADSNMLISEVKGVTIATIRMASIQDERVINALAKDLFALVDEKAVRRLVVDFRAVSFLSSQMLGTIISLNKKAKSIDGELVLAGLKDSLMKIFKIMRLEKILVFAKDESDAIKKFSL